ncbi:hypothetical protein CVT24_008273 [Panaeolus cyanescens]|uniref:Uncharacterized protein n=1 Tax=Panaeolus cyanescens TaxID=181874 RepID=A0A409YR48_9AGAR|nr:hypothetical protein CVT24_008273 [Panaeolus cyanescens]
MENSEDAPAFMKSMRRTYLTHYDATKEFYGQTQAMDAIQKEMKEQHPEIFRDKNKGPMALQYLTHYARRLHKSQVLAFEMKAMADEVDEIDDSIFDVVDTDVSEDVVIGTASEDGDYIDKSDDDEEYTGQALVQTNYRKPVIPKKNADETRCTALEKLFRGTHPDLLPHFFGVVDLKFIENLQAIHDYMSCAQVFKEDTLIRWQTMAQKHGAETNSLSFEKFHHVLTIVGKFLGLPGI